MSLKENILQSIYIPITYNIWTAFSCIYFPIPIILSVFKIKYFFIVLTLQGKTYYHIFTAGVYPQATITTKMLQQVVSAYDKKFHDAPVWIGHLKPEETHVGNAEPPALAWIDSLFLQGDKLYASFYDMSEKFLELISKKIFKYVSAEFVFYIINATKTLYLHALALTNRPAVDGMEPLSIPNSFSSEHTSHVFNVGISEKINFNQTINFLNQTSNTMNQSLIDIAKALGINTDDPALNSDDALSAAIQDKIKSMQEEFAKKPAPGSTPAATQNTSSKDVVELQSKIDALQDMLFSKLIDDGIEAGKVLPAQRDSLISYAKQDYTACKALIDAMPVNITFTGERQIKNLPADLIKKINLSDPKFTKDGKKLTYNEVIKDVDLLSRFNDDELIALKEKSSQ